MVWNNALPTTGTKMVDTATIYPDNWVALEEWLDIEHYVFTDATSGRHHPGETAVMSASTTTVITSSVILSSTPGSGAVAWSTDRGHALIYTGGGWYTLLSYHECDINVYLKTPLENSWQSPELFLLKWDTEDNDPRSLYASGSVASTLGYFTCSKTGKYLVTSTFSWTTGDTYIDENIITLYVQSFTSGGTVTKTLCAREHIQLYEGDIPNFNAGIYPKNTIQVIGTMELTATDKIQSFVGVTLQVTVSGSNNIRTTFLSVKRIE